MSTGGEPAKDGQDKKPKEKWAYRIEHWLGQRREGKWIPESVATNLKRKIKKVAKAKDWTKKEPKSVIVEVEELVYAHHGYRPHLEGEKNARKAFFFRGARVWRD